VVGAWAKVFRPPSVGHEFAEPSLAQQAFVFLFSDSLLQ